MAEELETSGTDDACEWWLVSTSADLLIANAGPPGKPQLTTQTRLVKRGVCVVYYVLRISWRARISNKEARSELNCVE